MPRLVSAIPRLHTRNAAPQKAVDARTTLLALQRARAAPDVTHQRAWPGLPITMHLYS